MAEQQGRLSGKTAIVTGAGAGIGASVAQTLAEQGCVVYVADIVEERAHEQADRLGPPCEAVRLDVRDVGNVAAVMASVQERRGGLDILVNSAGILCDGPYDRATEKEWESLMGVNVTGVFHCMRAAASIMRLRKSGSIINLASVSAFKGGGSIGNVWYGASKAAVVAMTQGLSRELGPAGIRVNAIAPGLVETEMIEGKLTPANRESMLSRFPMGRLATTRDVADLALFLASDCSAFITGQVIAVDGGYLNT